VFTARYELDLQIKQLRFVFKWLSFSSHDIVNFLCTELSRCTVVIFSIRSWRGVVGRHTGQLRNRFSIPSRGKRFFLLHNSPDGGDGLQI
jgi:hypothetical protein